MPLVVQLPIGEVEPFLPASRHKPDTVMSIYPPTHGVREYEEKMKSRSSRSPNDSKFENPNRGTPWGRYRHGCDPPAFHAGLECRTFPLLFPLFSFYSSTSRIPSLTIFPALFSTKPRLSKASPARDSTSKIPSRRFSRICSSGMQATAVRRRLRRRSHIAGGNDR